jgi:hypothetical protein
MPGLSAALTKATVDQLDEGILHVFATWHLYGRLRRDDAEPDGPPDGDLGAGDGHLQHPRRGDERSPWHQLFHETLRDDPLGIVLDLGALGVMSTGLIVLAGAEGARQMPRSTRSWASMRIDM